MATALALLYGLFAALGVALALLFLVPVLVLLVQVVAGRPPEAAPPPSGHRPCVADWGIGVQVWNAAMAS